MQPYPGSVAGVARVRVAPSSERSPLRSTVGFVKIRNGSIELHVTEDGDPSAPPILLLHGITSFGGTWEWIVPSLAERFRVLRLDFRGHGASDRAPEAYSPAGLCERRGGRRRASGRTTLRRDGALARRGDRCGVGCNVTPISSSPP